MSNRNPLPAQFDPAANLEAHQRARETAAGTIARAICAQCRGRAHVVATVRDSALGAVWLATLPLPSLARHDAADGTLDPYPSGVYPHTTNTWLVERPAGDFLPAASCETHGRLSVDADVVGEAVAIYRRTGRTQKVVL